MLVCKEYKISADGEFGINTENAVKDFQEHIQMMIKNNIVSDKIQIYQLQKW